MNIQAVNAARPLPELASTSGTQPSGGAAFGGMLEDLLSGEAVASAKADHAIQALAAGKAEGMHTVTLAVAQADLQFRLILELRNRLTEAHQEVMRMQV
jgi:flagellar hook-basal body complex protein FliE